MKNDTRASTAAAAEAQLNGRSSPSEDSNTAHAKDHPAQVHVHDETPLLRHPSEGSGYGALPPSTEETGPSGVDARRSWRQPSVSSESSPLVPNRYTAPRL